MPKRIKFSSDYWVSTPDKDLHPFLENFFKNMPKNQRTTKEEAEKFQLEDELFQEPYFIPCNRYFEQYNFIKEPFKVIAKEGSICLLEKNEGDKSGCYESSGFNLLSIIMRHQSNDCLFIKWDESDMNKIQSALNETEPFSWYKDSEYYLFGKYLWSISEKEKFLNEEELRLVFLETIDKERRKFEKLKNKFSGIAGEAIEQRREPIPEDVRIYVWRRDEGKCVKCGSQEKLEFDHIIPVSKGGSSTARNIQLLCERCNREKHDKI